MMVETRGLPTPILRIVTGEWPSGVVVATRPSCPVCWYQSGAFMEYWLHDFHHSLAPAPESCEHDLPVKIAQLKLNACTVL